MAARRIKIICKTNYSERQKSTTKCGNINVVDYKEDF